MCNKKENYQLEDYFNNKILQDSSIYFMNSFYLIRFCALVFVQVWIIVMQYLSYNYVVISGF